MAVLLYDFNAKGWSGLNSAGPLSQFFMYPGRSAKTPCNVKKEERLRVKRFRLLTELWLLVIRISLDSCQYSDWAFRNPISLLSLSYLTASLLSPI